MGARLKNIFFVSETIEIDPYGAVQLAFSIFSSLSFFLASISKLWPFKEDVCVCLYGDSRSFGKGMASQTCQFDKFKMGS